MRRVISSTNASPVRASMRNSTTKKPLTPNAERQCSVIARSFCERK